MKTIDTPTLRITQLDEITVLVEAFPEVSVDASTARRDNETIATMMTGDYGMIVDRKADYSIVPLEVYGVLNSMSRLKALAIVAHRPLTAVSTATERPMYKRPFRTFTTVRDAHEWLWAVLRPGEKPGALAGEPFA